MGVNQGTLARMKNNDKITFDLQTLASDGYAIVPDVVASETLQRLIEAIGDYAVGVASDAGRGNYAMRNLLGIAAVREIAGSSQLMRWIHPVLGETARPVRGILFDKTPDANWKVAWHQDVSIAVKQRLDVPGFGPWSVKAGVPHVQPPVGVLEKMLTLRLHLDDCDADNGPLRVIPGSHDEGILPAARIARWRSTVQPVPCLCAAGGVVVMRPLILHASSAATSPRHRRVVHIEYATGSLPHGLEWHAN